MTSQFRLEQSTPTKRKANSKTSLSNSDISLSSTPTTQLNYQTVINSNTTIALEESQKIYTQSSIFKNNNINYNDDDDDVDGEEDANLPSFVYSLTNL